MLYTSTNLRSTNVNAIYILKNILSFLTVMVVKEDQRLVKPVLALYYLLFILQVVANAEATEKPLGNQCISEDCNEDSAIVDSKWIAEEKRDENVDVEAYEMSKQETQEVYGEAFSISAREGGEDASNDNSDINLTSTVEATEESNDPSSVIEENLGDVAKLEVIGFEASKASELPIVDNKEKEVDEEDELEQTPPRRRYFPLLYTFRTLLNSFLSDFGEDPGNQEGSFNATDTTNGSLAVAEDLVKDLNTTVNGTDASKKTRFQCATKNITSNTQGKVKIVNSTELLEILNFSKNLKVSTCVLVMFYAPWCHFCARTAPHYNALARAFPQLDVLAVDTSHFSYLNARFGTVAVPNVMLFHLRSAVRFNHTTRVLENFSQFVTNNTGLLPDKNVKLEPTDFVGPLPSVVVRGRDWLLWLAWTFVIMCSVYSFVRSQYGQSCITRLRVLWQEHQHIE